MRRRRLLGPVGAGFAAMAGCLSVGPGSTAPEARTVSPVDDPPEWLRESGACDYLMGILTLAEPVAAIPDGAGVVASGRLSETARTITRFAIHRGTATTCGERGGTEFQRLAGQVDEYGIEPYREARGTRPEAVGIETDAGFHEITRLAVFDMVFV